MRRIGCSAALALSSLILTPSGVAAKTAPTADQIVGRMLNTGIDNYFVLNTAAMAAGLSGQLELLRQAPGKPLWSGRDILQMTWRVMSPVIPQMRKSMVHYLSLSFDPAAATELDRELTTEGATHALRCSMSMMRPNKETGQPSSLTSEQWSTCENKIEHAISVNARSTLENIIISSGRALTERENQLAMNKAACAAIISIITPHREVPMRRQVTPDSIKVSLGGVKYTCAQMRDLT